MFLKIKKIPKVNWSSTKPYNFKPKFSTLFFCCFGLMLFGLGEGLLIVSFTGASPWSVLAQGISLECKSKYRNNYIVDKYFSFNFMDTSWPKIGYGDNFKCFNNCNDD